MGRTMTKADAIEWQLERLRDEVEDLEFEVSSAKSKGRTGVYMDGTVLAGWERNLSRKRRDIQRKVQLLSAERKLEARGVNDANSKRFERRFIRAAKDALDGEMYHMLVGMARTDKNDYPDPAEMDQELGELRAVRDEHIRLTQAVNGLRSAFVPSEELIVGTLRNNGAPVGWITTLGDVFAFVERKRG